MSTKLPNKPEQNDEEKSDDSQNHTTDEEKHQMSTTNHQEMPDDSQNYTTDKEKPEQEELHFDANAQNLSFFPIREAKKSLGSKLNNNDEEKSDDPHNCTSAKEKHQTSTKRDKEKLVIVSQKFKKTDKEEPKEKELGDDIKGEILSFLPLREAITTSILLGPERSGIWRRVSNLFLIKNQHEDFRNFFSFIRRALQCLEEGRKNKFHLVFSYCDAVSQVPELNLQIDGVLLHAKQVKELVLLLSRHEYEGNGYSWDLLSSRYQLPASVYENSFLETLRVQYADLHPAGDICWDNLKKLEIVESIFRSRNLQKILCGCPLLQSLILRKCKNVEVINCSNNPKLTILILHDVKGAELLEITVPKVKTLELSGNIIPYKIFDVSSVENLTLDFELQRPKRDLEAAKLMLEDFSHSKHVFMGPLCLQIFSTLMKKNMAISSNKWRSLTLCSFFGDLEWPGAVNLIETSPCLHSLTIILKYPHELPHHDYAYFAAKRWNSPCVLQHFKDLKLVVDRSIPSSRFPINYNCHFMLFVKHIIKNATNLENMIIQSETKKELKELGDSAKEVLRLQNSSVKLVVLDESKDGEDDDDKWKDAAEED